MTYSGELAAIGTAVCWTLCAVAFTQAGARVGSRAVNIIRIVMALGLFVAYRSIVGGMPLPFDAPPRAWMWLSLSGLVGLTIGDLCIFRSFGVIGARSTMLILALTPPMTAILDLVFRDQRLTWMAWGAMAITLAGVCWVILESEDHGGVRRYRYPLKGVLLGLGGAVCQAVGNIMSAEGMELDGGRKFDAFGSTQIRVLASVVSFVVLFTVLRWWPVVVPALKNRRAMAQIGLGAVVGPFLGVTLLMLSFQLTQPGIAATIVATTPVLVIPLAVFVFHEKIGLHAIAGAVIAVAGVVLLTFDKTIVTLLEDFIMTSFF